MRHVKPFSFDITDEEIEYFAQESARILRSGILILGEHTTRFEQAFAQFIGVKHAIAVNSGTSALEIILQLKGVQDKTVLVPTNTNFATVAAVIRAGGRVRYLDMDQATFAPTLSMVQEAVDRQRKSPGPAIAGVLWVHIGGIISPQFPAVVEYCRSHGWFILEDAAHAHGSQLHGVKAGNLADGAAFSFFPTKVMTTCEGGMITTNSDEEDFLARSLRNQGKRGVDYGSLHHDFGNSSRMTEINALLGLMQLKKLPQVLRKRQMTYQVITKALDEADLEYVSTRHMDAASQYKLIVPLPAGRRVEEVKARLASDGVVLGGAVYDLPCHRQPVFEGICTGERFPGADRWCPHHICPPLTTAMTEEEAKFVGASLVKYLS
jgi:dTDP-4-amino-4,6-dideoxygalactose transaminase